MAPPKVCYQCRENIENGKAIMAMGTEWHEEHFTCKDCNCKLSGQQFLERDNWPCCQKCFYNLDNAPPKVCHKCRQNIESGKAVTAMGTDWHEDHFTCKDCNCKLIGEQFVEVDNAPCCQACYKKRHADKCKGCGKPITTQAVVALDAKWHKLCFKCCKCGKPIMADKSYKSMDGKAACIKC